MESFDSICRGQRENVEKMSVDIKKIQDMSKIDVVRLHLVFLDNFNKNHVQPFVIYESGCT